MIGNMWGVGVQAENIIILMPPRKLSKDDAVEFAAWIVALAETRENQFLSMLDEINSI